ncbi:MAG: NADPH-dependent FMN reductase [Acidimicrobiales bacterium]
MKILAVSGSLQAASSNAALLDAAATVAPRGTEVVRSVSPGDLPHFNPDLEADGAAAPAAVTALRAQIRDADAVLIATPEYAHSLPGSLKNALDWMVGSGDLYAKPVAILAGSPREDGAGRGRAALEQTLRAQGSVIAVSRTIALSSPERADAKVGEAARAPIVETLDALAEAAAHPTVDWS